MVQAVANPQASKNIARRASFRGKQGRIHSRRVEVAPMIYTATARREGHWWSIYVPQIDSYTQARTRAEIEHMARDLIAVYEDIPLDAFAVRLTVKDAARSRQHTKLSGRAVSRV